MFQYSEDDIGILDEGDGFEDSPTMRTLERIDFVYFLDESSPRLARGG